MLKQNQYEIDKKLHELVNPEELKDEPMLRADLEDKIAAHIKYYGVKAEDALQGVFDYITVKGLEHHLEHLIREGDELTWDDIAKEWVDLK